MINLWLKHQFKYLFPGYNNSPAHRIILHTIFRNRGLILVSFISDIMSALLEGFTLGVLFLALRAMGGESLLTLPQWVAEFLPGLANWVQQDGRGMLIPLIGLAVFMQILRSALSYLNLVSVGYLSARVQTQMTHRVFGHILSFSFPCASRYKLGDLTSYISTADGTVRTQINLWSGLVTGTLLVLTYGATLLTLSIPMSTVALGLALGLIGITRYLNPRLTAISNQLSKGIVEISKEISESIQALRLIHTFGHQRSTILRIQQLQGVVHRLLQKQALYSNISGPVNSSLTMLILGGLLWVGALLIDQNIVLPALATFIVAMNRLSAQLQGVMNTFNGLALSYGDMQRLSEILRTTDKQFTRSGGEPFKTLTRGIVFDQVTLRYDGIPNSALHRVSINLPKNSVTALVGESGAGKSSLVDLLIGLYDPTEGAILVDGIDLRHYSLESWRDRLGVVSQDTFVFNQSILENIRYGRPDATTDEVRESASLAQADHFIQLLPQGYDTIIGERGYRLSGGQRQRLALARAILKQPEILVLDEATSALDSQSERLVQQALAQFENNRTVLVIAHRLSTIVHAHQILVLERGKIIEQGTHEQLLSLNGHYARSWEIQVGADRMTSTLNLA